MGGDNAPDEIIKGCIDAIKDSDGYEIMLIGDSEKIKNSIGNVQYDSSRLQIYHTSEVVTNDDTPTKAIKSKKDSSMVVGFNLLKEKKGDAFISAGNTGALMAGALFILGRIEGIDRPALAPIIPTMTGGAMLIDAGLNTVCRPINYLQFAIIGSIFMKEIFKIQKPKIGLLNVGAEQRKGNEVIRQAHSLLSKSSGLNFVGNIEGKDLPIGAVNVAVCDGFVGNILLKFTEGVGSFIFNALGEMYSKNIVSKLSYVAIKDGLKKFKKKLDPDEYGGTPILGVNGIVFKCHGSSKAKAVKNAVIKAYDFTKTSVLEQIKEEFKNMEVESLEQTD